ITASITFRAIGAATAPPEAASPAPPPFSTITATATLGSSAGANAVNQASGAAPGLVCAVPVLPATLTPGICARVPVPDWTTPSIMVVISAATSGVTAVENGVGSAWETVSRSDDRIRLTRYGCMTTPLLATPAATIAI